MVKMMKKIAYVFRGELNYLIEIGKYKQQTGLCMYISRYGFQIIYNKICQLISCF